MISRSFTQLATVALDRILPEPSNSAHPVAWWATALTRLEAVSYKDSRIAGSIHLATATGGSVALTRTIKSITKPVPHAELVVTTAIASVACGGDLLCQTAMDIQAELADNSLDKARALLPHLVGRNPAGLDQSQISRAVIESLAENTVDAATATLIYSTFFGADGAWLHRTINTLDAMIGHHTDRYENFGWASAKTDDIVNWLPARFTVLMTALAAKSLPSFDVSVRHIVGTAFTDGKQHPSPNAGRVEAAFAAALQITLGGTNSYDGVEEDRGLLGSGPAPSADDITKAVQLCRRTTWLTALVLSVVPLLATLRNRNQRR